MTESNYGNEQEVNLDYVIDLIQERLDQDRQKLHMLVDDVPARFSFKEQQEVMDHIHACVRATGILLGTIDLDGKTIDPSKKPSGKLGKPPQASANAIAKALDVDNSAEIPGFLAKSNGENKEQPA